MPIFSSPTKDATVDAPEPEPSPAELEPLPTVPEQSSADPTFDQIQFPIGRLGAITRVRNQIEGHLKNVGDSDPDALKDLYKMYLVKVENLYEFCASACNTVQHWLIPHRASIDNFRRTVEDKIYPPRAPSVKATTWESRKSSTSSARVRLVEEKAALAVQKEFNAKRQSLNEEQLFLQQSLEKAELNIRLERQRAELAFKSAQQSMEAEEEERRVKIVEEELDNLDMIPKSHIPLISPESFKPFPNPPLNHQAEVFKPTVSSATAEDQHINYSIPAPHTAISRSKTSLPPSPPPRLIGSERSVRMKTVPTDTSPAREYIQHDDRYRLETPQNPDTNPNTNPRIKTDRQHFAPTHSTKIGDEFRTYHRSNSPLRYTPQDHKSPRTLNMSEFDSKIIEVLHNQTELSRSLLKVQETSNLPKKELEVFDGEVLTDFKGFMSKFNHIIEKHCTSEREKLSYLQQYTKGRPRKLVDSCAHSSDTVAFQQAKDKLYSEYDNEFRVANSYLETLMNWPAMRQENAKSMEELALFLLQCHNYLTNMSVQSPLQSPNEILMIVNKLPHQYRQRWRRRSHAIIDNFGVISFKNLVDFVNEESAILNTPIFGKIQEESSSSSSRQKLMFTQAESLDANRTSNRYCEFCKKDNHYISYCRLFGAEDPREKSKFIHQMNLCFGCLRKDHQSRNCPNKMTCKVCNKDHPTILHDPARFGYEQQKHGDSAKVCSTTNKSKRKIIFPIIPVIATINNKQVTINCALDTCSTDCWVNEKLLKIFNINPSQTPISVTTLTDIDQSASTRVLSNIILADLSQCSSITIPVTYTKAPTSWPFTREDLATQEDVQQFPHFDDVPLEFVDADVDMLIGMNMPALLKPLEIVSGSDDEPYAVRHLLGWCIEGPVHREGKTSKCNIISVRNCVELNNKLETLISQDFIDDDHSKSLSVNDKEWLDKTEASVIQLESKNLQIDLPLKDDVSFLCNKQQIYSKFLGLKKRLFNNENLYYEYKEFMQLMIDSKFVERVPISDLKKPIGSYWYINHHPVFHKTKGKIRIVFNCSLKYKGTSLNDNLLQGPDLAGSLLGVLLRFRQEPVAVVGDIRKMYYQVKVPSHHADFLRFFWLDEIGDVIEFRLLVHVFGATSSPSIANFALKDSINYTYCDDDTKFAIRNNFYVDDFLKSVQTEQDAVSTIQKVSHVLSSVGFTLTAFNSNNPQVLADLPQEDLSKDACIHDLTSDGETRALGVIWKTKEDKFSFKGDVREFDGVTKRNMLKLLASTFDPLGLLSPIIMIGKRLFQEACRKQISWDDDVPDEICQAWKTWLQELSVLNCYEIPRCLKLSKTVDSMILHTFSDGSETAYGAVSYVAFKYEDGSTSSSLIASRSRVTPLNNSTLKTIPRIELAAAKVAVELSTKLQMELQYDCSEIYWSDSVTVLNYIKSDSARFQRYVSNKVCYIRNLTSPIQWKYVPSILNPADMITRGSDTKKLSNSSMWNNGPDFLRDSSTEPKQDFIKGINIDDKEIKKESLILTSKSDAEDPLTVLMKSCSSWFKLKNCIGAILLLKKAMLAKQSVKGNVELIDMNYAEICIIQFYQNMYYSEEMKCCMNKTNLPRISPIRKLNPFLDSHQILRVGGRLANSDATFNIKHPIILPSCYAAELIIREIHCSVGHLGVETILSNLRKNYWIIKANTLTKRIVKSCVVCRKVQGKTQEQIMANLPKERVTGDLPAFTNTGTDYFGPFLVKHGRKSEKVYGVIFTCMSSRAVHIELANNLTTDSFINALRRFIARRGNVKYIVSDNGTNLAGGYAELKSSIGEWNESQIDVSMRQMYIEWKFNTPTASHFGGFFEREIRTIRKVLNSVMTQQNVKLTFEELHTVMCEVESVLNSRPLTRLSEDPSDLEPLTPNHLLLCSNFATFPPGVFKKNDIYVRKRWRQIQYLANIFWTRWKREYMALMQERQKWTTQNKNVEIGDIVLVYEANIARNMWPVGKVIDVKRDGNGHVRSCALKVSRCRNNNMKDFGCTTMERPITKLVKLC